VLSDVTMGDLNRYNFERNRIILYGIDLSGSEYSHCPERHSDFVINSKYVSVVKTRVAAF
jgi:hypothetical protein